MALAEAAHSARVNLLWFARCRLRCALTGHRWGQWFSWCERGDVYRWESRVPDVQSRSCDRCGACQHIDL